MDAEKVLGNIYIDTVEEITFLMANIQLHEKDVLKSDCKKEDPSPIVKIDSDDSGYGEQKIGSTVHDLPKSTMNQYVSDIEFLKSDCKKEDTSAVVKIDSDNSEYEDQKTETTLHDVPKSTMKKCDHSEVKSDSIKEDESSDSKKDTNCGYEVQKLEATLQDVPKSTIKKCYDNELQTLKESVGDSNPLFKFEGNDNVCDKQKFTTTLCGIPEPNVKKHNEFVETPKQSSTKYYAVSFPLSLFSTTEKDHPLIFTNKIDALQAIKKYPEARFREFISRIEAIKYASLPLFSQVSTPMLKETGERLSFKSITSQEMVQLRKSIESGNESLFLEKVWSNPRYLINNADGPTVMQEGTRYNALHVAARFKQTGMCLTILSVIHDKQFLSTLYPEDKPLMIEERINHLVDLYLNMPDKSLSETPVHFACKFGCDSILAILLSYPQCDINKKNKYGIIPKYMVCARHVCGSVDHKKRMLAMFEEIFYVPIMRDEKHNFVGEPCQANAVIAATSYPANEESNIAYCAFAGPMSESAAAKFFSVLKTKRFIEKADFQKIPFSPEEKTFMQICLSDSKKGLERIGRKLAKDLSTGWLEFWNPLDCWLDLSSEFGLDYLNNHLRKQEEMISSEVPDVPLFDVLITSFIDDFIQKLPVILTNMNKMTFFHLFQTLVQHMCCFTKYTFSKEGEIYLIHEEIGHLLYLKLNADNKNNFDVLKFYLNTQFNLISNLLAPKWKMFLCVLKFACSFNASNAAFLKLPSCNCKYVIKHDLCDFSSKSCYSIIQSLRQNFSNTLRCKTSETYKNEIKSQSKTPEKQEETSISEKKNEASNETHALIKKLSLDCETKSSDFNSIAVENSKSFLTPSGIYHLIKKLRYISEVPQNPVHNNNIKSQSSLEDEDDNFFTPPESPSNFKRRVFVNDQELSDDDIDIFRAIVDAGVHIDKIEYPYVFNWKCLMESKLGSVLKPEDKISCTPTSSSATVLRAVTPKLNALKRVLF